MDEFLVFALVGDLAQLVDGALGMAYGVTSSTVLLAFGVPPAHASASVHAAELFTTAASGTSHALYRNVDWRLLLRLAPAGMVGGAIGAYVLTGIDGDLLRPYILAYLAVMGVVIIWRTLSAGTGKPAPRSAHVPLGAIGGFVDAVGGGGWGPVVTTSLVGSGEPPRYAIGSANAAEFFVTAAISAAFVAALLTGHWENAGDLTDHAFAVAGLIVGGVIAAPFAGYLVKIAPTRVLGLAVGCLVIGLSIYQGWRIFAA